MKRPTISVIIPVYNAEKYLRECLESVQNQTFKDLEIICVNDGSTDGSLEILKEFADNDQRFKILDQNNKGINAARLFGYSVSSGRYITCVDSDDFLKLDAYEKMMEVVDDNEIVVCNYRFYPSKSRRKIIWYHAYIGDNDWRFIARNTLPWNKLVKKEILDNLGIDKLVSEMGENAIAILLASSKKIVTIDEQLYNYRVGHNSFSSNYRNIKWFKQVVLDNYNKYLYSKTHNLRKETQKYFFYSYLYYNLVLMAVASRNDNETIYKDAKKLLQTSKFFSKQNRIFIKYCMSLKSRVFLFCLVYPSYHVSKISSKLLMR